MESLLQSEWLIRMVDKAASQPKHKLLALFDVLEDTLSSPLQLPANTAPPPVNRLQAYLTTQSLLANAQLPEMLAHQLYFMALSACQEKHQHPQSTALGHAKLAAQALITEQIRRQYPWQTMRNYAIALSALGIGLWVGYGLSQWWLQPPTPAAALTTNQEPPPHPLSQEASPSETAAIYERLETMKHGDCRMIEAIQLPERLKSIYIENVVNGHVTTNRGEQILVNQLLDQVKCNYTPKLMQNAK